MISTEQDVSLGARRRRSRKDGCAATSRTPAKSWTSGRSCAYRSVAVDLAYEEFCLRWAAGERPDLDAFCDRFPTLRQSLRSILLDQMVLARHIEAAENVPCTGLSRGTARRLARCCAKLGRGTFARVYLALEESTGGRPVAVKFSRGRRGRSLDDGSLRPSQHRPGAVRSLRGARRPDGGVHAVSWRPTLTDVMDLAYPTLDAPPPREAAVIRAAIRSAAFSDDPPPLSGGAGRPAPARRKAASLRTPSPASPWRSPTLSPSSTRKAWSTWT